MKLIEMFEMHQIMHDCGIDDEQEQDIQGLYSNEMLWISETVHV